MKNAIIFVDVQNDLIDFNLRNPEAQKIIPSIIRYSSLLKLKLSQSEDVDTAVFCTQYTHKKTINVFNGKLGYINTLEGQKNINEHCILGTYGWLHNKTFYEEIGGYATILQKDTYAYKYWDDYLNDIDNITVCGLYTDTSVLSNVVLLRTIYPNKKITVLSNLCAGTTIEKHKSTLDIMPSLLIDVEELKV